MSRETDTKPVVLIVEDDELVREVILIELEEAGFEVMTAQSGDEASFLLLMLQRVDLLLTDIRMPGSIDGWALADMARCHRPNLPVIYASGFVPQKAREVEGSIFIAKPYRAGDLIAAINKLKAA